MITKKMTKLSFSEKCWIMFKFTILIISIGIVYPDFIEYLFSEDKGNNKEVKTYELR